MAKTIYRNSSQAKAIFKCNFLLVYLQTSPQVAYDRIKKRGRSEEGGIQMSFLENLNRLHEDWFIYRNSTTAKKIPAKK